MGFGKAANQCGDVFDGIQTGGDPGHNAGLVCLQPHGTEVFRPVHGWGTGGKIQPIVYREQAFRVELSGDQKVYHGVRDSNPVVQLPQSQCIDGTIGQPGEGAPQVVQTVITVYRGHGGEAGPFRQESRHHVAPGPMAVN